MVAQDVVGLLAFSVLLCPFFILVFLFDLPVLGYSFTEVLLIFVCCLGLFPCCFILSLPFGVLIDAVVCSSVTVVDSILSTGVWLAIESVINKAVYL